jgi:hypothetical protein
MSYKSVRKELAAQTAHLQLGRCITCGGTASSATLSSFGARCGECYAEYCRQPVPLKQRSPMADRVRAEISAMSKPLPL